MLDMCAEAGINFLVRACGQVSSWPSAACLLIARHRFPPRVKSQILASGIRFSPASQAPQPGFVCHEGHCGDVSHRAKQVTAPR